MFWQKILFNKKIKVPKQGREGSETEQLKAKVPYNEGIKQETSELTAQSTKLINT